MPFAPSSVLVFRCFVTATLYFAHRHACWPVVQHQTSSCSCFRSTSQRRQELAGFLQVLVFPGILEFQIFVLTYVTSVIFLAQVTNDSGAPLTGLQTRCRDSRSRSCSRECTPQCTPTRHTVPPRSARSRVRERRARVRASARRGGVKQRRVPLW